MSSKADDLEAVRLLAETLQPFPNEDRERIIRWARENSGWCLRFRLPRKSAPPVQPIERPAAAPETAASGTDIKSFVTQKAPTSDAQSWFRNHRPAVAALQNDSAFKMADQGFASLLEWADQNTARAKYRDLLQTTKTHLVKLRSSGVLVAPSVEPARPQFQLLISDPKMLGILERRWTETLACQRVGADLAATVMLGGLLEALFLARINKLTNLAPVFTAAAAPKDKAGKSRPVKEWGLKDYLDVAKELRWIRQSAEDVGLVLRDYRNCIHPEKELSHGVTVVAEDTAMFVNVFTSIAEQIIKSA